MAYKLKKKEKKAIAQVLYWVFIGWWLGFAKWLLLLPWKLVCLPFTALRGGRMKELQRVLLPGSTGKVSNKELVNMAKKQLDDDYQMLKDCMRDMQTIVMSKAFDSKMALADQAAERMGKILSIVNYSRKKDMLNLVNAYRKGKAQLIKDFEERTMR